MSKKNIIKFKCKRCKHSWFPRDEVYITGKEKPIICPKCKSPYWDKDYKKEEQNK